MVPVSSGGVVDILANRVVGPELSSSFLVDRLRASRFGGEMWLIRFGLNKMLIGR